MVPPRSVVLFHRKLRGARARQGGRGSVEHPRTYPLRQAGLGSARAMDEP